MTQVADIPAGVSGGRSLKAPMIRAIVAATVLLGGFAGIYSLEKTFRLTFTKPYQPLRQSFTTLPPNLGFPNRYTQASADENLPHDQAEQLGTPDYLLRTYADRSKSGNDVGRLVRINLNYYGTGSASPHVPEICWSGAGREEAGNERHTFVVKNVKHQDGTTSDLVMRLVSFQPTAKDLESRNPAELAGKFQNVAYVFHVNGDYVATPHEVTSHFWNAAYKYAYHAKIEINILDYTTPAEAEAVASDFIREALPEIEKCLPDPKVLLDEPATKPAAAAALVTQ